MELPKGDWSAYVLAIGGPMLAAILFGRTLRRLILFPFQKWAARTENKLDDQLVKDAEKDLGIEDK